MEEPLLGASPRSLSFKDRLIFGTPNFGASYLSLLAEHPELDEDGHDQVDGREDMGDSHEDGWIDDDGKKSITWSLSGADLCMSGKAYSLSTRASYQDTERDDPLCDDMFFRTSRERGPSLTRLDLDERAVLAPLQTPTARSSICNDDGYQIQQRDESSHTVVISSEECKIPNLYKYLRRSRTAPAVTALAEQQSHGALPLKTRPALQDPPMSVVSQAFIGLLLYLAVGVVIYIMAVEEFSGSATNGFFDALYFCIVTMCTIGYGDITPVTPAAKVFSCIFVLVGFGFIDFLLSAMVTYVLQRQETLLINTVAAGPHATARTYLVNTKKGRMRIRTKVIIAFGVVILCIAVGTFMMHALERLGWLDSFYLSCMSVTTVGYGDHAFKTLPGRVFASAWLLVSTVAVAQSFLYLAEARIDKRHRLIAKMVLEKEMTVGDLVAADLDNDGSVSKSDFVVYKLKQMGKIDDKDIVDICKQFSRLDSDNSGKITLSCLVNLHKASMQKNR